MEKICSICAATSTFAKFYAGVNCRCADCHKAKVRENRAAKADYYRAFDAKRYRENPEVKERSKRYQATQAGKQSLKRSRAKWLSKNPDKRAAHIILGNAVRDGRISKPKICEKCGSGGRIHGHHEDYTLPLVVIWCCPKCHEAIHKGRI